MHSFHAYVDESGDEGFTFKDPPERASSEWFVISAVVARAETLPRVARKVKAAFDIVEGARQGAQAHFSRLPHEARTALVHEISRLPIRVVSICVNKRAMAEDHTLRGNRRLYFYACRFLMERVSWISRDYKKHGTGDGRCKLTFSRCKNLSYEEMTQYFQRLKSQNTTVSWDNLDTDGIKVQTHGESIWLKSADAVASGIAKAIELDRFGFCEDRFALAMKPITYSYNKRFISYGLKFFPQVPTPENNKANRYSWLASFR